MQQERAFDKVAKILGLGYPGGPVIEIKAESGRDDIINFPRAMMGKDSLDFSFSGLKTAVSLYVGKWREDAGKDGDITIPDIASSFQEAVFDVLVQKLMKASISVKVESAVVAGGVACNSAFRKRLNEAAAEIGINIFTPAP